MQENVQQPKAPLPHGVWHEATVMAVQHAADSFTKSGTTETLFCHFINLLVKEKGTNGRLVKAQMCNSHQQLTFFKINDEIRYNTNKYVPTKDRYTISSYEVVKSAAQKKANPDKTIFDMTDDVTPLVDTVQVYPDMFPSKDIKDLAKELQNTIDAEQQCSSERKELGVKEKMEAFLKSAGVEMGALKEELLAEQKPEEQKFKNAAWMIPDNQYNPRFDKVQAMIHAQHNAALCYQMRGNFSEKDILSLAKSFFEQISGVLDDEPKKETEKASKAKGKVK